VACVSLSNAQFEIAEFQLQMVECGPIENLNDAADLPHLVLAERPRLVIHSK
jgi:hypothetical protein